MTDAAGRLRRWLHEGWTWMAKKQTALHQEEPFMVALANETTASGRFPSADQYRITWLAIDDLMVDPSYQRTLDSSRVKRIESEFTHRVFGVVMVNRRGARKYAVVDGQHRVEALRRLGEKLVPCVITGAGDIPEEASDFRVVNTNRGPLSRLGLFKARVREGDVKATIIKAVTNAAGFVIGYGEKGGVPVINAVSALEWIYDLGGEDLLNRTLRIVAQAWPKQPKAVNDVALRGVALFLHTYTGFDVDGRLVAQMQHKTALETVQDAQQAAANFGGKPFRAFALRLFNLYNWKLTTNALPERINLTGTIARPNAS